MSTPTDEGRSFEPGGPLTSEMRRAALVLVGRGDQEAFATLYDDLVPAVYRLVSLSTRDHLRIERAVQQTFLDLWTLAPDQDVTHDLSVEAWVLATAHQMGRAMQSERTTPRPSST